MSEAPTPSWSQFVKAHRAAQPESLHDQAERIACVPFDWLSVPTLVIDDCTIALTRHRRDPKGRRGVDPLTPTDS
jgi:hypothetical protein